MRQARIWAAALCALLCTGLLSTAALAVAEPTEAFYVADYADVLSEDTEQYIVEQNESLFNATGGQIVVVAVDFMDGMTSGDYAMAVVENWGGIGDAERNNGFLLVYAVGENKGPCPPPALRSTWRTTSMTATTPGSTTRLPGTFLTLSWAGMTATTASPPAVLRAAGLTRRRAVTTSPHPMVPGW